MYQVEDLDSKEYKNRVYPIEYTLDIQMIPVHYLQSYYIFVLSFQL